MAVLGVAVQQVDGLALTARQIMDANSVGVRKAALDHVLAFVGFLNFGLDTAARDGRIEPL
jgi:hypothetical protein